MNHGRDARRLGGGLLLWALIPFPFVYIILAPFWIVAAAAGLWRLLRPQKVWQPSALVQNLFAVLILVAVLAAGGLQIGPLRPLGHLLLALTALRVASIVEVKDLRRALPAVFLVGIVGIVSSVHVSAAPYLLLSVIVWWYAGMWVFLLQLGEEAGVNLGRPRWNHAAAAGLMAAVLAIPVFLVIPRFGSPFLGGAFGGESGFPDAVELARRGSTAENESSAIFLNRADGREIPESWLRLRATVYEMSSASVWVPRRSDLLPAEVERGRVWLTDDRSAMAQAVAVDVSIAERSEYLFIPPGGIAIETAESLLVDSTGGVALARRSGGGVQYRVWVAPGQLVDRSVPHDRDTHLPVHNQRVCDLANQVAGEADNASDTAARFEAFLKSEFSYSLAGGAGGVRDPVAWFLFEQRSGHCEFFAAAMVVMLRHQGVPARLVVGYHGGVSEEGSSSVVVRQSNAHAWVEVWLGGSRGWVVFDPTPAEGVDGLGSLTLAERLKMAWQSIEDFFDRRVLTFGLDEQVGIIAALTGATQTAGRWVVAALQWWFLVPAVAALVWLVFVLWRTPRARGRPASLAVARLGRLLERRGMAVPASVTIRGIGARAARGWPRAASELDRLVHLAEHEQYGPAADRRSAGRDVRKLWSSINKVVRRNPPGPV